MTHELVLGAIRDLGGQLERIVINDLAEGTFFAKLVVDQAGRRVEIDCRPSDAIALAIGDDTPIFCEEHVLAMASLPPGQAM
jgi:bifunctional DNase/RNase